MSGVLGKLWCRGKRRFPRAPQSHDAGPPFPAPSNDPDWGSYNPDVELLETDFQLLLERTEESLNFRSVAFDIHDKLQQHVLVSYPLMDPEALHWLRNDGQGLK